MATSRTRHLGFGCASSYHQHRPPFPAHVFRRIIEAAGRKSPHHSLCVLDIGSGTGRAALELARRGANVVAVDKDPAMLQVLSAAASSSGLGSGKVQTIVGRAESLDMLEAGSIDVVTCFDTFHWLERGSALSEISRVLRPRGVLAVAWNDLCLLNEVQALYRVPRPNDKRWHGALTSSGLFKPIAGCPQPERIRHIFNLPRDDLAALCATYDFGDLRPRPWTDEAAAMGLSGGGHAKGSLEGADGGNDGARRERSPADVLAAAILRLGGGGSAGSGESTTTPVTLEYETKLYLTELVSERARRRNCAAWARRPLARTSK